MKTLTHFTVLILCTAFLSSCGDSSYTSSNQQNSAPTRPDDPVGEHEGESDNGNQNYVDYHCSNLNHQERYFYTYLKNVQNQDAYAQLIESQGNCTTYNGWIVHQNGNGVFYEYNRNAGTTRCEWWSRQPMGVTVAFFAEHPSTASIAIDATGDGFASGGGQGFPVRRSILNAQIDCTQEDLTIYAYTPRGYFWIIVPQGTSGHKNAPSLSGAKFYFGNSKLGGSQMRGI